MIWSARVIGLLKAAARIQMVRWALVLPPYARHLRQQASLPTNLRDHGFAIQVPPFLRATSTQRQKLLRRTTARCDIASGWGSTAERGGEFQDACSITAD